jgi:hypothetical protein
MKSRISLFCDGLIETGWLLALILVPLFFNVFSSRVFEPDKIAILRAMSIMMLFAWVVKAIELKGRPGVPAAAGLSGWRFFLSSPAIVAVSLLALSYALSTVVSILPYYSFWGSYERSQGLFTMLAYIVVFLMLVVSLKRREQLDRIVDAVILTGVPIAVYGIAQRYGIDPVRWSADLSERVGATLGNPIFAGAYMIMVLPVTMARLMDAVLGFRDAPAGKRPFGALVGYAAAAGLQALCIVFTRSRGPWIGILGGVVFFVLLFLLLLARSQEDRSALTLKEAARAVVFSLVSLVVAVVPAYLVLLLRKRGYRWLWFSFVVHVALLLGFLLLLNLPQTPLSSLKNVPFVESLGRVTEFQHGTGRVRVLIWQGTARMIGTSVPRAVVGYGPEIMKYAWGPFHSLELSRIESSTATADRSHNETFDDLVATGFLGLLIFLSLLTSGVYLALRWLGLLVVRRQTILFLVLSVLGRFFRYPSLQGP